MFITRGWAKILDMYPWISKTQHWYPYSKLKRSVHFKLRMLHTWTHDFSLQILQFSSPNFLVAIPASSFLHKKLEQGPQHEKFCFKLIDGWTMEHNLLSALCFPLFPSVFLLLACQSPMCMQAGLVVSESIVSKHPYLYRQPMLHDVCTWSWVTNCLHLEWFPGKKLDSFGK
jgi:hypothetical protein